MSEQIETERRKRIPMKVDFDSCPYVPSHGIFDSDEYILRIAKKAVEMTREDLLTETKQYIDDSIPEIAEKATEKTIDNICIQAGRALGRTLRDKLFWVTGIIIIALATGISLKDAVSKLDL